MKPLPSARSGRVHLVTQARPSKSDDIGYRERRYLIMMGVRIACFVIAIIMFTQGAGWLTAIPAVGAVLLPYFAVVLANGGREPTSTRGFREYQPRLPERHPGPGEPGADDAHTGQHSGTAGEPDPPGRPGS